MENIEKTIDEIDRIKEVVEIDLKNEIVVNAIFDTMYVYTTEHLNFDRVYMDDKKIIELIALLYPHRYKLRLQEIKKAQEKAIKDAEKDGIDAIVGKIGGNV